MHFNIYLDDETGRRLNALAEKAGESRNALIRKAVGALLDGQSSLEWPEIVLKYEGIPDWPAFEDSRREQPPPSDDPLA